MNGESLTKTGSYVRALTYWAHIEATFFPQFQNYFKRETNKVKKDEASNEHVYVLPFWA